MFDLKTELRNAVVMSLQMKSYHGYFGFAMDKSYHCMPTNARPDRPHKYRYAGSFTTK